MGLYQPPSFGNMPQSALSNVTIPPPHLQHGQPVNPPAEDVWVENATNTGQEEKKQPEVAEENKPKPKPDQKVRPRPVASTPIPGTVWCVVRTDDGKCFFYDPSKRRSVWKRPEELKNRLDVDKLLSAKPEVKTVKEEVKNVEEEPPSKKIRLETEVKEVEEKSNEVIKQSILKEETAMEDEVQEDQHRSVDSIEDRMKQFRELLAEKDISVNSTWEKELHKIACDKRYLLLTVRERKHVFDEYVKDRAEEERHEKNRKIKEKNELYRQLLEECTLNGKSTLSDFLQRCSSDKNFASIDNMCDWESIFLDYMSELAKQKQEKAEDEVTNDFIKMLSEILDVNCCEAWCNVKSKFRSDPRYKAVVKDSDRKELFREYLKTVNIVKNDFMKMLGETQGINCSTIWSDVKNKVRSDPRYIAVGKDSDRKELFNEYLRNLNNVRKDFMKMLSEIPDIKWNTNWTDMINKLSSDPCYMAVNSDSQREDWFREYLKTVNDARDDFMKMLSEIPDINCSTIWSEVKHQVRSDPRYNAVVSDSDRKRLLNKKHREIIGVNCGVLWDPLRNKVRSDPRDKYVVSVSVREEYFMEYLKTVNNVSDDFMKMLSEIPDINCCTIWSEVKHQVRSDPRYKAVVSDSDRKRLFSKYLMTVNDHQEPGHANLYIANLPFYFKEKDLENILEEYGRVISTRILRKPGGVSRGVGFAKMKSKEKCYQVINAYNNKMIPGCREPLLVKFAERGIHKTMPAALSPRRFTPERDDDSLTQHDPGHTNLYIANLPVYFMEKDLEHILEEYGRVISTRILYKPDGESRGVGFASMESKEICDQVIKAFNKTMLPGCREPLLVKFAERGSKKKTKPAALTPQLFTPERDDASLTGTSCGTRSFQKKHAVAVRNCRRFLATNVTDSGYKLSTFMSLCNQQHKLTRELHHAEMEILYDNHLDELERNRTIIWSILDENDMSHPNFWLTVKTQIQADTRITYYNDNQWNYEKKYAVSNHKKFLKAIEDFQELLKETKLITKETKMEVQQGTTTMRDIKLSMKEDDRYTALTCISAQRDKIIFAYIDELSKKN